MQCISPVLMRGPHFTSFNVCCYHFRKQGLHHAEFASITLTLSWGSWDLRRLLVARTLFSATTHNENVMTALLAVICALRIAAAAPKYTCCGTFDVVICLRCRDVLWLIARLMVSRITQSLWRTRTRQTLGRARGGSSLAGDKRYTVTLDIVTRVRDLPWTTKRHLQNLNSFAASLKR